jgi:hypothetical protein
VIAAAGRTAGLVRAGTPAQLAGVLSIDGLGDSSGDARSEQGVALRYRADGQDEIVGPRAFEHEGVGGLCA